MFQSNNFKIEKFTNEKHQGNMYVILFKTAYFIIDPCVNFKQIEQLVENKKCSGVLITHAHYDHFEEAQSYIDKNLTFYMHQNAKTKLLNNENTCSELFENANVCNFEKAKIKTVKQNDIIEIDEAILKIEELFGHTDCSIGVIIENCFFVGDCIFEGGNIGRYDLATGSSFQTRATLRRLRTFDLYLKVFSGHGNNFILKDFWNK